MTDDFHQDMSNAGVSALWERPVDTDRVVETPHLWPWNELDPLMDAAVDAVDTEDAERRVLVLENPAYQGTHRRGIGLNMVVNLQILMPGETARPHRHTFNALRFVIEGDGGAVTIVNGEPCAMFPGDFLLTPGWCWHEHSQDGEGRAVWLDALDVPLHSHFETGIFEPGPSNDIPPQARAHAYAAGGLMPVTAGAYKPYSPIFKYPLENVTRALSDMTASADGSKRIRYTNPVTGAAAMPGLDCYMLAPSNNIETRPYRTNANMVCLAVEGEGVTQAGETTINWHKNDIFSLPRNHWIIHRANSADAKLFQVTDRETLARLDYLSEEFPD